MGGSGGFWPNNPGHGPDPRPSLSALGPTPGARDLLADSHARTLEQGKGGGARSSVGRTILTGTLTEAFRCCVLFLFRALQRELSER